LGAKRADDDGDGDGDGDGDAWWGGHRTHRTHKHPVELAGLGGTVVLAIAWPRPLHLNISRQETGVT
jgi:hypothetical protein